MKNKLFIGIDPDLKESGIAYWYPGTKILNVQKRNFYSVIEALRSSKSPGYDLLIIIEAGWLNSKSNFRNHIQAVGERIAKNVGENHAIGKLIEQFCIEQQLPYRLIRPTQSKTSAAMFLKLTGQDIKNQEMIDAAMLVFGI